MYYQRLCRIKKPITDICQLNVLILLQFIEWQLIITSENTVFIYHLNKFALSTRNKDKERRGKRNNVSACLWKKILERLNRFKDNKELWVSSWSPCFSLTSSKLWHVSTTLILCPHKSQHVYLLVSVFPFHPSHLV